MRRRGGLGTPVLGHRGSRGGPPRRPLPRGRARRGGGLLHDPYRGADAAAGRPLRRARPATHRLLGLPRPRPPALHSLPRLRPARPRAQPRARSRTARWPPRRAAADGLCIWLTGLSGSGKSTVGRIAAGELRDRGYRVEMLDGDDVRQNICDGLGFSREDREVNVRRIAFVADLLARNGVVTFVAAVSPYRRPRDDARARMGERFVEVYVRASVEACEDRDVKGLYRARPRRQDRGVHRGVRPLRGAALARTRARHRERERAGLGGPAGGAGRGAPLARGADRGPRLARAARPRRPRPASRRRPARRRAGRAAAFFCAAMNSARACAGVRFRAPSSGSTVRIKSAACRNAQAKPSRAEPAVSRMISSSKPGSGSNRWVAPPV